MKTGVAMVCALRFWQVHPLEVSLGAKGHKLSRVAKAAIKLGYLEAQWQEKPLALRYVLSEKGKEALK